jgi:hypothetical protein
MLSSGDADGVAACFGLGGAAVMSGPVARGEPGQVWRVETARGRWAVKEPFDAPVPEEVADDAAYQDAVRAAGVPMPEIVRTVDGDVLAGVGSAIVRVYGWVDLKPLDRRLDAVAVGRLLAAIHRVGHRGRSPVHWWYTDPVGADRWDELVAQLAAAGAPFAGTLAAQRDELAALECLRDHAGSPPPQTSDPDPPERSRHRVRPDARRTEHVRPPSDNDG